MAEGVQRKGEWRGQRPNGQQVIIRWNVEQWESTGEIVTFTQDEVDSERLKKKTSIVWFPVEVLQDVLGE